MLIYISRILLTTIVIIDCTNAVPLSDFISFGQSSGDLQFSKRHRAASPAIAIPSGFLYFNKTYNNIYVSSHGYVTFSGQTAFTTLVNFPFKNSLLSVICPFWANIDQRISGTTYFRSVSSSSQIDKIIRRYFSYAKNFTTKWALITTWEKVGYYNSHADKVNTFQVAVATNGSQSFAIFNYLDNGIQWSSADNTGGVNGIGPNGAQVGFNGGDGVHSFVRPETQSDSILELDDNSNVCVRGLYVFRIDGETVQPGRCVNIQSDTCSKEAYRDKSPKLIILNVTNIVSVNLDTTVVDHYEGIHCHAAFGVEYDLVNRMIYWSEDRLGLIRRVSFDNSFNGSAVETIVSGLSHPEQIAVDWVNRKLYWTDRGRGVIEFSDLDGRNIELMASRINAQAIAIDPFHKTIYWINFQSKRIEKASITGRYRQSIVTFVLLPSGLTIDYHNNLLYWTDDGYIQKIYSCDLGGHNCNYIPVSIVITDPYAITVFKSNLYWTDRSNSYVDIVNQFTGRSEGRISASLNGPTDIDVLDSSRQPGALHPFIIKDTFIHSIIVLAPNSFTISVEFIAICMNFNITWEFNGNQVTNDSNHMIIDYDLSNSRYKTSVKILQSSERDEGTYTVTVSSVTGNDSTNITVKISSYCMQSTTQDAYLLFTDYNSIQRVDLDGSDKRTVISNVFNIHGLDFDILTNTVYWCERDEGNIYRANIDSNGRELIVSGLSIPEEVAVDWINRKLYWSDSGTKTIQYSNLDGSDRRLLLINTNNQSPIFVIDKPRAVAVDPFSGHIYWTDWGVIPKIEKMTLDRRNRHIIISSYINQPNGLTIDYATLKLYWVDAFFDKIETSDLEGRGRRILLRVPHPYGITVHNSILYWTDWVTRLIASTSTDDSTALHNITSLLSRPSNVHVVHYSTQPGAYIIKDSFIQHVKVQAPECFTLSVEFISACDNITVMWQFNGKYITSSDDNYMNNIDNIEQSHYKAILRVKQSSENDTGTYTVTVTSTSGSDRVNISARIINDCTLPALQDAYLLFTDFFSIRRINLDGSGQDTEVSNLHTVHALDFDILTNTIYWSEVSQGNIYRASLDSSGKELIVRGLRQPENVVVDWINRKLYWCDAGSKTIEYSKLDGSGRMLLLDNGIDRPRGLAVDPFSGNIYWADWGAIPKIERVNLSDNTTKIIIGSGIVWPSSLTIDFESAELYWADAFLGKIEVSNLDGSERVTLYGRPSVRQPYGIAVHNGILYWTDWITRSVISGRLSTDDKTLHNITFGTRPSGIYVVHYSKQPGACAGNCSSCLDKNPYIFINNKTLIEKRTLAGNGTNNWENVIKMKSKPLGFDVDVATCTLFWGTGRKNRDVRLGKIYASNLIDGNSEILHSDLGYPRQIAVNWITRKLYWSDTVLKTIEYSDLDGANRQILLSNVKRVEAIAIDPRVNDIYWVSFQARKYAIEKMKLDGTDRHVIVSSSLQAPNSLVIDFASSRLYWTDINKIATSNFEGDDKFTIYTTLSRRPTALSMYNNELFWAEWIFEKIVSYIPDDGNGPNTFVDTVTRTEMIQVIHKSRKPRSCYDVHPANDTVPP